MAEPEFERLLSFFKALANESRLRIVGILANREASVSDLADLLEIREPTVSHHLSILKELDLVRMEAHGNVHIYSLNEEALLKIKKDVFSTDQVASMIQDADVRSWKDKVLETFVIDDRLTQIPAQLKKRVVILQWLAEKFKRDRRYTEREVNEVLRQVHPDVSSLRRYLVSLRFMDRDHGIYWRLPLEEQLEGLDHYPSVADALKA